MAEFVDQEFEDDDHESRFEDIESRLDELSKSNATTGRSAVSAGYCVGAALATVLSWDSNHALGWAAVHGLLSWLYIIYYLFTRWASVKLF